MLIVVLLPAALLITVITCFGLGTLLSAMNVKYRDFRYALPFIIQILMFVSPVIYAPQFSQQWAKIVMSINPMCGAISLLRFCITGVQPDLVMIAISCASSVFLLLIGLSYFRKTESYFADLA